MLDFQKKNLIISIFSEWNKNGTKYYIVHGLEEFPYRIGRDIDIVIEKKDCKRSLGLAKQHLLQNSYIIIIPPEIWGKRVIGIKKIGRAWDYIEIHSIEVLSWGFVEFNKAYNNCNLHYVFKTDDWLLFVKSILLPYLSGDSSYKFIKNTINKKLIESPLIRDNLSELIGSKLARVILDSIRDKDTNKLRDSLIDIRKKLSLGYLIKSPFRSSLRFIKRLIRNITKYFSPCAPVIAIVGTDGVGKTSCLQAITDDPLPMFAHLPIVRRHWRPGILPALSSIFKKDSHYLSGPPRRQAGRLKSFRMIYYYIDFLIGQLKDNSISSHQQLIIYDRCALDMIVDPVRFGLSSNNCMKILLRLIPKPDTVILLYDDPDRIYHRKPELTIDEIDQQQKKWWSLYEKGWVNEVIKIDAPAEEIAQRINDIIARVFVEKNNRSKTSTVNKTL